MSYTGWLCHLQPGRKPPISRRCNRGQDDPGDKCPGSESCFLRFTLVTEALRTKSPVTWLLSLIKGQRISGNVKTTHKQRIRNRRTLLLKPSSITGFFKDLCACKMLLHIMWQTPEMLAAFCFLYDLQSSKWHHGHQLSTPCC